MKKSLVQKCLFGRSTGFVIPISDTKKIFASNWPVLFLSAAQITSHGQWNTVLGPNTGLPLLAPINPIHAALLPSR